jgi:RsmE family RNA methyltransferase
MKYTYLVNIILFDSSEAGKPLSRRDERTLHLLKVLHKKPGDTFDAGIIGGSIGTGLIESVGLDGLHYSLDLRQDAPPRTPIRVGVGFPRPIQLRRLLRDLSTFGVESIDLISTDLGEKSYRNTTLLSDGGARSALVEGAAQSRDTRLPEIQVYRSLDAWLAEHPWEPASFDKSSFLRHSVPLLIAPDNVRPEGAMANLTQRNNAMVLAIGCERGWSDRERDILEHAGFLRMSIGTRALRTETACIAAVTLAMEKIGVLG